MVNFDLKTLDKSVKGYLENAQFLFNIATAGFFNVFKSSYLEGYNGLKFFFQGVKGTWAMFNCSMPSLKVSSHKLNHNLQYSQSRQHHHKYEAEFPATHAL